VVSVVTVPQQTPLSEGRRFVSDEREVIDAALEFANEERPDIPVSGKIRIGHDVSKAILNTIEQDEIDIVLMGWRGRGRRTDYVLGSNVDRIVTQARCDVLVERMGPAGDVNSILVPTAGGPHAEFAAEIAVPNDARVEVLYVSTATDDDGDPVLEDTTAILDGVDVDTTLVEDGDVIEEIIDRSGAHDITIIGASRESLLEQLVFGAIPEEVGRRAKNTVIMAKRDLGITSRVTRWFRGYRRS